MLHHLHSGSGPPILLAHGIGMSHRAFAGVIGPLAASHEVFAVDLPGFGASPLLAGPPTLRALADACADFMAAQGHARFHVAGNSLGGGIALQLALDGRALSACALSPVGFAQGWERAYLQLSIRANRASAPLAVRLGPLCRFAGVRRALVAQMAAHGERLTPEALRAAFADLRAPGLSATAGHALNWRAPHAAALPCPVTIAWGEHDHLLLFGPQSARAHERFPHATHVPLPGCGHLSGWDDPGLTARVIREATSAQA